MVVFFKGGMKVDELIHIFLVLFPLLTSYCFHPTNKQMADEGAGHITMIINFKSKRLKTNNKQTYKGSSLVKGLASKFTECLQKWERC